MAQIDRAFSGFSVADVTTTEAFYGEALGLELHEEMGGIALNFPSGQQVFIYAKDDHQPATFTVLNLVVDDIDQAVDELIAKNVTFERYDNLPAKQDERGVLRGKDAGYGPNIAWFKDPSGNILALVEE